MQIKEKLQADDVEEDIEVDAMADAFGVGKKVEPVAEPETESSKTVTFDLPAETEEVKEKVGTGDADGSDETSR